MENIRHIFSTTSYAAGASASNLSVILLCIFFLWVDSFRMERPQVRWENFSPFYCSEPKSEYLRAPEHHTGLRKHSMTYFQLQMNTVAVTFADIFLFEILTAHICFSQPSLCRFFCATHKYEMPPSFENISPTSTTVGCKWHYLESYALGIVIK
jgi:hypothetical protein